MVFFWLVFFWVILLILLLHVTCVPCFPLTLNNAIETSPDTEQENVRSQETSFNACAPKTSAESISNESIRTDNTEQRHRQSSEETLRLYEILKKNSREELIITNPYQICGDIGYEEALPLTIDPNEIPEENVHEETLRLNISSNEIPEENLDEETLRLNINSNEETLRFSINSNETGEENLDEETLPYNTNSNEIYEENLPFYTSRESLKETVSTKSSQMDLSSESAASGIQNMQESSTYLEEIQVNTDKCFPRTSLSENDTSRVKETSQISATPASTRSRNQNMQESKSRANGEEEKQKISTDFESLRHGSELSNTVGKTAVRKSTQIRRQTISAINTDRFNQTPSQFRINTRSSTRGNNYLQLKALPNIDTPFVSGKSSSSTRKYKEKSGDEQTSELINSSYSSNSEFDDDTITEERVSFKRREKKENEQNRYNTRGHKGPSK